VQVSCTIFLTVCHHHYDSGSFAPPFVRRRVKNFSRSYKVSASSNADNVDYTQFIFLYSYQLPLLVFDQSERLLIINFYKVSQLKHFNHFQLKT